jgi:hypothetical protein
MATSSLLGIDADNLPPIHSATGNDSMGPSDASDSGSDSAGVYSADPEMDTDRYGTGERASVEPGLHREARDILPDHMEALSPADDVDGDLPADPQVDVDADLYPEEESEEPGAEDEPA